MPKDPWGPLPYRRQIIIQFGILGSCGTLDFGRIFPEQKTILKLTTIDRLELRALSEYHTKLSVCAADMICTELTNLKCVLDWLSESQGLPIPAIMATAPHPSPILVDAD